MTTQFTIQATDKAVALFQDQDGVGDYSSVRDAMNEVVNISDEQTINHYVVRVNDLRSDS